MFYFWYQHVKENVSRINRVRMKRLEREKIGLKISSCNALPSVANRVYGDGGEDFSELPDRGGRSHKVLYKANAFVYF